MSLELISGSKSKLAIVIPAFKIMYFDQVLLSIANQTCKNFTLYIGDDASLHDFKPLIDLYTNQIRIIYKRFKENKGGKDLVEQWERCIDLVDDEEWIWLFSDDDMMDVNCVENFYKTLHKCPQYDLFHFPILKINEENNIIENCFSFPNTFTVEEFLENRLNGVINSFAIEYIFRKSHFLICNRFQNFDLGWGSDDATWIKLGKKKDIKTIENSNVYWRKSQFNISPNLRDGNILKRKLNSQIEFAKWVIEETKNNNIGIEFNKLNQLLKIWFRGSLKQSILFLPFKTIGELVISFHFFIDLDNSRKEIGRLYAYKIYAFLKKKIKIFFQIN